MSRRYRFLAEGIAFVLALLTISEIVWLRWHLEARASGPLPQEAYVWQRRWTPRVDEAVARAAGLANLVVLAAEADPGSDPPQVARVAVDWAQLVASRPGAGLALRILPFPGRFADRPQVRETLAALAAELATTARARGLSPSEIQLDYDCAETKLDDYRDLILAVRRAVAPLKVTLTALPSWLPHRRAFADLAAAADGYVLQVHSLAPPARPGDAALLCDPAAARQAVEAAARFHRPFRVALPTYGYLTAFRPDGSPLGLTAEGPASAWPAGTFLSAAASDASAMAGLVRLWTRDRPAELAGLLWFRLPASSDHRNWSWETFQAVVSGNLPPVHGEARAVASVTEPGLVDLALANPSASEASPPPKVRIRWRNTKLLAADGLAGYQARSVGTEELWLERSLASPGRRLSPGERRPVGWLRFAAPSAPEDLEVQSVAVVAAPTAP
ncbi:MAG TPA: DUF3142 domain-containing protein [Thermoanaerobaculia bacterium]|nr:DUF3142 domain-containing protein [Thermoanaerobaculia bacterium]